MSKCSECHFCVSVAATRELPSSEHCKIGFWDGSADHQDERGDYKHCEHFEEPHQED